MLEPRPEMRMTMRFTGAMDQPSARVYIERPAYNYGA
jgi:hypothetical protein